MYQLFELRVVCDQRACGLKTGVLGVYVEQRLITRVPAVHKTSRVYSMCRFNRGGLLVYQLLGSGKVGSECNVHGLVEFSTNQM